MPRLFKMRGKSVIRRAWLARVRAHLRVEELESRTVPSAGQFMPMAAGHVSPSATGPAISGPLNPAQIRHAYGIDQVASTGLNQTIAIVDAYDNPYAASDLQTFNNTFGLPNSSFIKVTPQGQPAVDTGWSTEIALDVQWAHVAAPAAAIVLVEAASSSYSDLLGAVSYATNPANYTSLGVAPASVVSMSWGSSEFSAETTATYDGVFANHSTVTFVASSGDAGKPPSWPAVSPNVVAVGGTKLNVDANGNYISESGWGNGRYSWYYGGSGGGISKYEPRPSYQSSVPSFQTGTSLKRTSPDVAYNADPNSGVYVLDSTNGGWFQVGGTSAGAPQWAGLVADVNQGRTSPLGSAALPAIYGSAAGDFHDITTGNNGYAAQKGYDLVTGIGSPVANKLIPDLTASTAKPLALTVSTTAPTTTTSSRHSNSGIPVDILAILNDPTLLNSYVSAISFAGPRRFVIYYYYVAPPAPVSNFGTVPAPVTATAPIPIRRTTLSAPFTLLSGSPDLAIPDDAPGDDAIQEKGDKPAPEGGVPVVPGMIEGSWLRRQSPALSRDEAVDICFANCRWLDGRLAEDTAESVAASQRLMVQDTTTTADRVTASAALFAMLGAVWMPPGKEKKRAAKRWSWRWWW